MMTHDENGRTAELPPVIPVFQDIPGIRAFFTMRTGGVSQAPWHSLNLGDHVGDTPEHVRENRRRVKALLPGGAEIFWMRQTHSVKALEITDNSSAAAPEEADAEYTRLPGRALAVMTADCLPVLLAAKNASFAAAVHCGWRGLQGGILENALAAASHTGPLAAVIGPGIRRTSFQIGSEVRELFLERYPDAAEYFVPDNSCPGKLLADLPGISAHILRKCGVADIRDTGHDTYADGERFFSYRRDRITGRMAGIIMRT